MVALLNFEILKLFSGPCGAFCYLGHFKKLRIIIIIIIIIVRMRDDPRSVISWYDILHYC